jgi:hypothetical protein
LIKNNKEGDVGGRVGSRFTISKFVSENIIWTHPSQSNPRPILQNFLKILILNFLVLIQENIR